MSLIKTLKQGRRNFLRFLRRRKILKQLRSLQGNTIFLFGCPIHPNMGDQAQTYCILKWLAENYPKHNVITFNWELSFPKSLELLRKKISAGDLLFGHSGYFFVDHHRELPVYREVATLFPDFPFTIFPQTINLKNKEILSKTIEALESHPNLTLMCRDNVSYSNAEKYFKNTRLMLMPDIVTSLIGTREFNNPREGILFCMRNDIEAHYSPKDIQELREKLSPLTKTELTDTSIKESFREIDRNRGKLLDNMLDYFSHFKVIITDRYHGTIFSLIANTPVIVLSSADHKLQSGVSWFPDSFSENVKFSPDLETANSLAQSIIKKEVPKPLPSYFADKYYNDLKSKIEST